MISRLCFALMVAAGALAVTACGGHAESAGGSGPGAGRGGGAAAPVPVTVADVALKAMPLEVRAIGSVESALNVAIRAQVTGVLKIGRASCRERV